MTWDQWREQGEALLSEKSAAAAIASIEGIDFKEPADFCAETEYVTSQMACQLAGYSTRTPSESSSFLADMREAYEDRWGEDLGHLPMFAGLSTQQSSSPSGSSSSGSGSSGSAGGGTAGALAEGPWLMVGLAVGATAVVGFGAWLAFGGKG